MNLGLLGIWAGRGAGLGCGRGAGLGWAGAGWAAGLGRWAGLGVVWAGLGLGRWLIASGRQKGKTEIVKVVSRPETGFCFPIPNLGCAGCSDVG